VSRTDIFLSYARHDRPAARIFAECFEQEGFSVWWDASLHSGETFDEVIEQRLRDARAVVVLWSPRSVASRWVRAEATLADRRNKLAPAIIEPCDRPIIFELTHAAELADWHGDRSDVRWQDFVQDLHRLVQNGDENEAAARQSATKPTARPQPASRQPLRPGNDEVVSASRIRQSAAAEAAHEPVAQDTPAASEIHCLEIEGAELPNGVFIVEGSGAKIGRSAPADFVLSHKSVSREHCIVGLANDELLVTDLNSTNGTYIDEVRISRASILPVGSVLRLGQVALRHSVRSAGLSASNEAGALRGERIALPS
jgi:hypothetical protein